MRPCGFGHPSHIAAAHHHKTRRQADRRIPRLIGNVHCPRLAIRPGIGARPVGYGRIVLGVGRGEELLDHSRIAIDERAFQHAAAQYPCCLCAMLLLRNLSIDRFSFATRGRWSLSAYLPIDRGGAARAWIVRDRDFGRRRRSACAKAAFHACSFRAIADDVGIKSASVHYHFRTQGRSSAAALVARYEAESSRRRSAIPKTMRDLRRPSLMPCERRSARAQAKRRHVPGRGSRDRRKRQPAVARSGSSDAATTSRHLPTIGSRTSSALRTRRSSSLERPLRADRSPVRQRCLRRMAALGALGDRLRPSMGLSAGYR